MNNIIESLYNRKSVRAFEPTPIADEVKRELIGCAAQAPTAGNQMLYTIIDVTDPAVKEKLAILCDDQPFIATAPVVLVFVADCTRWYQSYLLAGCRPRDLREGDLMLAYADACIAAQNVVVAAESLGLGSCYIGDILENKEETQALLCLPTRCVPACMLVIGYPTAGQLARKKPARFGAGFYLCENRYKELGRNELTALYNDRCARNGQRIIKPFDDYMREFCERKYNAPFSAEMSRSVAEYIKEFNRREE